LVAAGGDRVVPVAVKVVPEEVAGLELLHLPVGNLDARV
jgi:hypothetical protein